MKKSIIALMGVFALFACSDETVQEADKQNGSPEEQMGIKTTDPITPYHSPYDIGIATSPIEYIFENQSNLEYEAVAYVGLAYYDDKDDGIYHTNSAAIDLNNGDYPNLYASKEEYGFVSIGVSTMASPYSSFTWSGDHCLSPLSFGSTTLTPEEVDLLINYGKVYHYDVTITDPIGGNVIHKVMLQAGINGTTTTLNPKWIPLGRNESIELLPLYFHEDSKEIVSYGGSDWYDFIYMGTRHHLLIHALTPNAVTLFLSQ